MLKTCIIIAGPTAVGKTAVALSVAQHFHSAIISADSRQCFRELNIGVAKPSQAELQAVHHYFINTHSIQDEISAAGFEQYALAAAAKELSRKDLTVMVGGTGLYIKAFCQGMDEIPAVDPAIRQKVITGYESNGIAWLQEQLRTHDAGYAQKGKMDNPQRMMRALEVKLSAGKSIISFQTQQKKKRDFNILKIGLELPREDLYERINNRVDEMIASGLVEEARALFPQRQLNALQTVGYRELFEHFEGKISLEKAIDLIKQNTRNYAKRQMTWFKKDPEFNWYPPSKEIILDFIQSGIKN